MKRQIQILLLSLALAAGLLNGTGCQTSPQNTAYATVGSVGSLADAAIGAYADYIKTHLVPPEQIQHVRAAVQSYVNAMEAMRFAVAAYQTQADQPKLDAALAAASAASAQIVTLINSIVPHK